jgi:sulfite reductase beta subunit-like hemoprotein
VGRSPGKYNLSLGAALDGPRLDKLYRQDVGHDEIVAALTPKSTLPAMLRRFRDPQRLRRADHFRPRLPREHQL